MCSKPTVWVLLASSVPCTVVSVWVYTALFAVLSSGIFRARIVCILVNQSVTCTTSDSQTLKAVQCQSAWSYVFAVELYCLLQTALFNTTPPPTHTHPNPPQLFTFIFSVKHVRFLLQKSQSATLLLVQLCKSFFEWACYYFRNILSSLLLIGLTLVLAMKTKMQWGYHDSISHRVCLTSPPSHLVSYKPPP